MNLVVYIVDIWMVQANHSKKIVLELRFCALYMIKRNFDFRMEDTLPRTHSWPSILSVEFIICCEGSIFEPRKLLM